MKMLKKQAWVILDPKDEVREVQLALPSESAIAWPYAADVPERSGGWIEHPKDTLAAKKKGYRVIEAVLSFKL